MPQNELRLRIPDWLEAFEADGPREWGTPPERMAAVIDLSARNVAEGTGGPFAAAVFNAGTGSMIAAGVNIVVPSRCSIAHAEILAIALAQQRLGGHDLGAAGMPRCELATSTEPCAMCLGAVLWSGVRRLVCAARGCDAEQIGFDEGPKPPDWVSVLQARGIAVERDVCRAAAATVLQDYRRGGGDIYNARRGGD